MKDKIQYTPTLDGKGFMKDGDGNKIPLDKWENSPSDTAFDEVAKISDEEIKATMKRLGLD